MLTPLPLELPEAFTTRDARALGASERRLDADDLDAPFRGARILRTSSTGTEADDDRWENIREAHLRLMRAHLPVLPDDAYYCGPSAALLWRIPLPARLWQADDVHVGVHRPHRAPRRPGVVGYQHTRGFVQAVEHDGLPVTDPASTWATLGGLLSEDELVAAADGAIRIPRHPGGFRPVTTTALATREELEVFAARKGRSGAPTLRRAIEQARTGSASPPETQIRLILIRAGLAEPELDWDVHSDDGQFLGCSELAYPDLRVAMDYESDGHLTSSQLQRDIDEYQAYAEAGWYPVRLTSEHVFRDPFEAVRRVRQALRAASANSGPRPSIWR